MSDIAIRVENLSKLYRIGKAQQRHDTLREVLVAGLRAPLKRLSSFVDTPVKRREASSGMYVRLAFAVAAHLWAAGA